MIDTTPGAPAYAGVDTHKETHTLSLIDALGREVSCQSFAADAAGVAALAAACGDASVPVGVEGTRSYGSAVADALAAAGHEVYEVCRPKRDRPRGGKSDPIDARLAAEAVAAGKGHPVKQLGGGLSELRMLMAARDMLEAHKTAVANCADGLLTGAGGELRARFGGTGAKLMGSLSAALGDAAPGPLMALSALAGQWASADALSSMLRERINEVARAACPLLAGAFGVDGVCAARLMLAAGSNPERMRRGEASFSMLCGCSPIPASSGKSAGRHRLNRGGDRQANRAVHDIVVARMASDPATRAYIARTTARGKTKREAMRCLKRYVAREAYRLMTADQPRLRDVAELRAGREAAGLTQAQAASALGVTAAKIYRLESGKVFDSALIIAYDRLLNDLENQA